MIFIFLLILFPSCISAECDRYLPCQECLTVNSACIYNLYANNTAICVLPQDIPKGGLRFTARRIPSCKTVERLFPAIFTTSNSSNSATTENRATMTTESSTNKYDNYNVSATVVILQNHEASIESPFRSQSPPTVDRNANVPLSSESGASRAEPSEVTDQLTTFPPSEETTADHVSEQLEPRSNLQGSSPTLVSFQPTAPPTSPPSPESDASNVPTEGDTPHPSPPSPQFSSPSSEDSLVITTATSSTPFDEGAANTVDSPPFPSPSFPETGIPMVTTASSSSTPFSVDKRVSTTVASPPFPSPSIPETGVPLSTTATPFSSDEDDTKRAPPIPESFSSSSSPETGIHLVTTDSTPFSSAENDTKQATLFSSSSPETGIPFVSTDSTPFSSAEDDTKRTTPIPESFSSSSSPETGIPLITTDSTPFSSAEDDTKRATPFSASFPATREDNPVVTTDSTPFSSAEDDATRASPFSAAFPSSRAGNPLVTTESTPFPFARGDARAPRSSPESRHDSNDTKEETEINTASFPRGYHGDLEEEKNTVFPNSLSSPPVPPLPNLSQSVTFEPPPHFHSPNNEEQLPPSSPSPNSTPAIPPNPVTSANPHGNSQQQNVTSTESTFAPLPNNKSLTTRLVNISTTTTVSPPTDNSTVTRAVMRNDGKVINLASIVFTSALLVLVLVLLLDRALNTSAKVATDKV